MNKTRILLVDDHQIVRDGLRVLLESEKDFELVGDTDQGTSGVAMAEEMQPDVVVMDLSMPDLNGVEATRKIKTNCPDCKIVILSAHADQRLAAEAMHVGATGLVPKDSAFNELAAAIRSVMAGKVYLSPDLHGEVISAITHPASNGHGETTAFKVLTPREREVLQLLAEGKATKEVAYHMKLSTKTIETYRSQIMEKLKLDSIAELTKYAVREGITSL